MNTQDPTPTPQEIEKAVNRALIEDVGNGDVSANIIAEDSISESVVVIREHAILCGTQWFDEVFRQIDSRITVKWLFKDGDEIIANQQVCRLSGNSRSLLTGERTALNFLQTLSGVATLANKYMKTVLGTKAKIRDTRKTIPGMRKAQKYAVKCGGCYNQRMGLYDEILIKENHIRASGTIKKTIALARTNSPGIPLGVEVTNIEELKDALAAKPDYILLDNMDLTSLRRAVTLTGNKLPLEASGGVTLKNLRSIAETGVDYISVGSLTKDIKSVDLSMQFLTQP